MTLMLLDAPRSVQARAAMTADAERTQGAAIVAAGRCSPAIQQHEIARARDLRRDAHTPHPAVELDSARKSGVDGIWRAA
jgi:hypothetical protein